MSTPFDNSLATHLELLLGGSRFRSYSDVNTARADDLLVRQAGSNRLTAASAELTRLESEYRRGFVPESTREQPYPPADVMRALREIGSLKSRIGDIDARLRGGSAPSQDKVWRRIRSEQTVLDALLSYDRLIIDDAERVLAAAMALNASDWDSKPGTRSSLDLPLDAVADTLAQRSRLLQTM